MNRTRLTIAVVAMALLGAACGGGDDGDGGETTDSVTMVDNAFEPSDFTAAGDALSVTNDGQALHSFTVSDAGIDQDVAAGDSAEIDVSGVDPGTHDLTCKYHPEMTGSITVE